MHVFFHIYNVRNFFDDIISLTSKYGIKLFVYKCLLRCLLCMFITLNFRQSTVVCFISIGLVILKTADKSGTTSVNSGS